MTLYGLDGGAAKAGGGARCTPRPGAVAAAERVLAAGGSRARVGMVLGTGMGGLVDRLADRWSLPGIETGWLAQSRATGHAGRIVGGTVGGVPVAMLQGRVHGYEGFPAETLTRGVELLAALGVRKLLLTNAAGGLRPDMISGEIVVVTDHIDCFRRRWDAGLAPADADAGPRPTRSAGHGDPYDPVLADVALEAAWRSGAVVRKGVYALLSGPSYETRAEYRMLRRLGADVVGMSTVPEVAAAARLGIPVAVCSIVTNVAKPDAPRQVETDAEDVVRIAACAAVGVGAVLDAFVARSA
ncbi:MAG: purine-nucleoside phosphorylase [Planctomycetaceae bacterium]